MFTSRVLREEEDDDIVHNNDVAYCNDDLIYTLPKRRFVLTAMLYIGQMVYEIEDHLPSFSFWIRVLILFIHHKRFAFLSSQCQIHHRPQKTTAATSLPTTILANIILSLTLWHLYDYSLIDNQSCNRLQHNAIFTLVKKDKDTIHEDNTSQRGERETQIRPYEIIVSQYQYQHSIGFTSWQYET